MKFAQRIQRIQPSMTMAIDATARELAARGEDIIRFGAGEPDFPTPEHIKQAGIEAIRQNDTHYTPVGGTELLKEAIVSKFKNENGLHYEKNQIVVSCGAKHSFYNLAQVLWEEGDEILIPAPYWVSYPEMVRLTGATPVILNTSADTAYKITPDQIEESVTPKTRALVLNSPCNPTGSAYTSQELEALAESSLKHGLLIVSDEIYEKIVFDGFEHVSIASFSPEVQRNCVVINGVSKSYAMTGWRIGYLAAEPEIARQVGKLQGQSTSNPTSISQRAAIEALTNDQGEVSRMVVEFQKRRNAVIDLLEKIPGISCFRPAGSFYCFPDVSEYYGKSGHGKSLQGSIAFAEFLLQEAKVAVVPGTAFGSDANVRISFATSMQNIERGLERMAETLRKVL